MTFLLVYLPLLLLLLIRVPVVYSSTFRVRQRRFLHLQSRRPAHFRRLRRGQIHQLRLRQRGQPDSVLPALTGVGRRTGDEQSGHAHLAGGARRICAARIAGTRAVRAVDGCEYCADTNWQCVHGDGDRQRRHEVLPSSETVINHFRAGAPVRNYKSFKIPFIF